MMEQLALNLCVIPPARSGGSEAYRRAVQLLRHCGEAVRVTLAGRTLAEAPKEPGWITLENLSGPDFERTAIDLFLCWDLPALCEVLAPAHHPPIVYGLTMDDLVGGALPVHPRLLGYFFALPCLGSILTSCGIPLERQFRLAAGVDDRNDPVPNMPVTGKERDVLLLADDGPLITAVKSACELLGLRLERLPAAAGEISRELFRPYVCVVGSGQAALEAAAAGVAVVLADSRGSAGLLTPDNLQRILDADAGPTCFDSPPGVEAFLAALAGIGGSAAGDLASILRSSHSQGARARRFLGWLRQVRTQSQALPLDPTGGAPWPRMLSMEAMLSLAAMQAGVDKPENPINPAPALVPEVLAAPIRCGQPSTAVRLPMDRWISATDATLQQGFFRAGWSFGESWGRWTDGDAAVLEFECEPVESEMELQLHVQSWLAPGRRFQRATVIVNKQPLLSWKLDANAAATPYSVPLFAERLGTACSARIEFSLPDADSPFSWGRGDSRRLGFGLVRLRLAKASELPD